MRHYSLIDTLIKNVDTAVQTLLVPNHRASERPFPDSEISEKPMSVKQKKHVAGLMRVNHSGEVCAQGLYQGQALTAKLPDVREKMNQAALEEVEHLAWCEKRLSDLGYKPSVLNPLWYTASLTIGALAGAIGDKWSLGFVVETERQVTKHLESHLSKLPEQDAKSSAILEQMKEDEMLHADMALEAGGAELPLPVKHLMTLVSKLVTKTSYRI